MSNFLSMEELRTARNIKILASDKLTIPDLPFTQEEKDLISMYRKSLRDFPSLFTEANVSDAVLPELVNDRISRYL